MDVFNEHVSLTHISHMLKTAKSPSKMISVCGAWIDLDKEGVAFFEFAVNCEKCLEKMPKSAPEESLKRLKELL